MLPLIKRSTDNLVAVFGEKAASEESFEVMKYVCSSTHITSLDIICCFRVFGDFTLEAILATAFGRQVDLQKGESDEFSKAFYTIGVGLGDGQFEQFLLFNSKLKDPGYFSFVIKYLNGKGREKPSYGTIDVGS